MPDLVSFSVTPDLVTGTIADQDDGQPERFTGIAIPRGELPTTVTRAAIAAKLGVTFTARRVRTPEERVAVLSALLPPGYQIVQVPPT